VTWQGIEGHDDVVDQFRRSLTRGRMASTFLFVGPAGIGKRTLARKLAQALLCQRHPADELDPCGECPACVQVAAGTHPDLLEVSKPAEKSYLPVELLIGSRDKRMQEGLCHDIRLKPFMGGRRIAIIDDANYLNEEGANSLLKTLEEPPPHSVMILLGTSADRQLPTIRSRSQIVRFQPLSAEIVARLLQSHALVEDPAEARRLAAHCEGSLERAMELADPELWSFRRQLCEGLAQCPPDSVSLARATTAFVDAAGKEASARRSRARQLVGFAIEFYRGLTRALSGVPLPDDPELAAAIEDARRQWTGDGEIAAACTDRCLETLDHIDRNANQGTLIECWFDDLARIVETGQPLRA
jgi:DNA polymerase-3 subunit delta'